jgi:AcrR family transcriptional regulator
MKVQNKRNTVSASSKLKIDPVDEVPNASAADSTVEADRAVESDRSVRDQILDVAERLFAEKGVSETSVRAITSEAGVNVAAINYYFGTKDDLFHEAVTRRITPLNEERYLLLDSCFIEGSTEQPDIERILFALVAPSINLCFDYPYFARFASHLRLYTNKSLWEDYRTRQQGMVSRFKAAFIAALPELPESEVDIRLNYILGAIDYVWSSTPLSSDETPEKQLRSFFAFYAAALKAPAPEKITRRFN